MSGQDIRRPLDTQAVGLMLMLCLIWSLQQIVLKATAPDFSPTLQLALRSGIAALLVWLYMRFKGERLNLQTGVWRAGLLVGALFALEFVLLGQAVRLTTAGHVVVFLYSAPVFAALGLHLKLPAERLAPLQWLGIALAFGGIAVAFLGDGGQGRLSSTLLGDALALGAALAWGLTTVAIRVSPLSGLPATQTLFYQLVVGFVLLMAAAWALDETVFRSSLPVWAALAFNAVIVCFFSFLVWFSLLRKYLASRLGVFSFLTPILGVILGAWLLDEPVEPNFAIGAALVLAGIVLVSGYGLLLGWLQRLRRRVPARKI
ncbi:MAG: DMT family transporter [Comamonas sp.]